MTDGSVERFCPPAERTADTVTTVLCDVRYHPKRVSAGSQRRLIETSGDVTDMYMTALPTGRIDPVTGDFAFQDQEIHVSTARTHEISGMFVHAGANNLMSFIRQMNSQAFHSYMDLPVLRHTSEVSL